jgi:hypothetical protein
LYHSGDMCVFAVHVNLVLHDFVCVIIPGCCLSNRVNVDRLLHWITFVSLSWLNVSFVFGQVKLK